MPTAKKSVVYRRRDGVGTLTLHGVINLYEAITFHENARKALDDPQATTVTIDLAAADRLDLSALQILSALRRDLTQAGRSTEIAAPSDRVLADGATAGVTL